jgi:hypothetical protein
VLGMIAMSRAKCPYLGKTATEKHIFAYRKADHDTDVVPFRDMIA